jgi:1-acyl-sn-glycerol-3-phosphate acyltransferase
VASLVSIATLGHFAATLSPVLLRFWGRSALRIQGIKLEVEGEAYLKPRSMKVSPFNHTSTLDTMIITAISPLGGVSAIKREVLYVPFVGLAVMSMGFLLIDRGRGARARRVLAKAAQRLASERLTVFIAPEGTRSADGSLLPFKKGAFHLAFESQAPVVAVVIDGGHALHPRSQCWSRPGRIRVRILPPIPTAGLTRADLPAFVESLHARYEAELADMRGEAAPPG